MADLALTVMQYYEVTTSEFKCKGVNVFLFGAARWRPPDILQNPPHFSLTNENPPIYLAKPSPIRKKSIISPWNLDKRV